jgi:plasmid stabilization system protein ParE
MRLQILDLAKRDIIDGFHYYESKEEGLGNYFLVNIYADVESLKLFGGIHRQAYLGFHRALSKRFPFAIYYTVEDDTVRVRAVMDCRKNPSWIRRHLKKA